MQQLIDIFLHLDQHLAQFVADYGAWVYGLLFAIVFAETGLVITPFLPGDSLLFAAGALAGTGAMNVLLLLGLLTLAATVGNSVNYAVGRWIGPKIVGELGDSSPSQRTGLRRLINPKHVAKAHAFFEKHGGMAVVMGRFVPIVRTCVPFVAGAAAMTPAKFTFYNIVGAVAWVGVCVGAGYLFGNIPVVKKNFGLVTVGVIGVSLIPIAIELIRARRATLPAGT